MKRTEVGRLRKVHPYAWIWQPLEGDPGFVLNPMFGAKAAYLDGAIYLAFISRGEEPWRGLLVATDRERHPALVAEFPSLHPHPLLPKWLYLPETADDFEPAAAGLVALARRRDPRLGVVPRPRKSRKRKPSVR